MSDISNNPKICANRSSNNEGRFEENGQPYKQEHMHGKAVASEGQFTDKLKGNCIFIWYPNLEFLT